VISKEQIATVWQREGEVFLAKPGEKEIRLGKGRSPSIDSGTKGDYISWTAGDSIMLLRPESSNPIVLAKGASPKTIRIDQGNSMLIIWTEEGKIKMKKVS
jgi:hypothetical protein